MAEIRLHYRIVDVFTDRPLAGNALCVVLDPCPEPVMAALAREVNLSETSFPVVTDERSYEARFFTPTSELPFAGHPSLGTAWVLGPGSWQQTTPGATIAVHADAGGAVMVQPDPELREVDADAAAAAVSALGLPGCEAVVVSSVAGIRHGLVLTDASLDRLAPDLHAVARVSRAIGASSLAPLRRLDDATLHLRVFVPLEGIAEDPGTGSAAGPAGVLARQRWGTGAEVTILQGAEMGRPSVIEVRAEPGDVRVGGRVTACAEGHFTL
jgi:trans-2,3-dihydro-3-hydroxyanthranilate isomerase